MNRRLWFMGWIYSTMLAAAFVIVGGTVAIILNSAMLGNLAFMWGLIVFVSGVGMGTTFGLCEVDIPPKQPRLSRASRKALAKEREYALLQQRIKEQERELGVTRWHPDEDTEGHDPEPAPRRSPKPSDSGTTWTTKRKDES